jgi:hypothetical protein
MRMDKLTTKFHTALTEAQSLARDHQFIYWWHCWIKTSAQFDICSPTQESTSLRCARSLATHWKDCRKSRAVAVTCRFQTNFHAS